MEEKKTMLGIRVYNIAITFGVQKTLVHSIINSYIDYCKVQLKNGKRITLLGLCTLIPDYETDSYNSTLAYDCKIVSNILGLPSNTVYSIVNEYLEDIKNEVLSGKTASIRGMVTFRPLVDDGKVCKVHSSISLSFKNLLQDRSKVKSVRVATSKLLKHSIRQVS